MEGSRAVARRHYRPEEIIAKHAKAGTVKGSIASQTPPLSRHSPGAPKPICVE